MLRQRRRAETSTYQRGWEHGPGRPPWAQNPHPPRHTLGLHVVSGQSQMWRQVGPGLAALRLHPEVGRRRHPQLPKTRQRDRRQSDREPSQNLGHKEAGEARPCRPRLPPTPFLSLVAGVTHRVTAQPLAQPASLHTQGMNAHLKACTRLRSANSWSSTKA